MKLDKLRVLTLLVICPFILDYIRATDLSSSNKNGIFGSFSMYAHKSKTQKSSNNPLYDSLNGALNEIQQHRAGSVVNGKIERAPPIEINLGDGPYWNGWIKYFKYTLDNSHQKPTAFFKNMQYKEQLKLYPGQKYSEVKDPDGQFKYIPSISSFYAQLFKDSLVITSSKIVYISIYIG